MTTKGNEHLEIGRIVRTILLASLVLVLPAIEWSLFGWLHMFLPLLALYLLGVFGGYAGTRLLLTATTIGGAGYLLLGSLDLFLFTGALLFAGYVLSHSAGRGDPPHLSGLKGTLALGGSWAAVLALLAVGTDVSPYTEMLASLDSGINGALEYYRNSDSISAETLVVLEATLFRMKIIFPIIMPAILGSLIMLLVWFTMVSGNALLAKSGEGAPWTGYRYWQLPEKLIWIAIGTGVITLLPLQPLRNIAINLLILLSIVYCFQGLSVTVFFMNKWNVPILLRSFFYVMIIFQSFGTILLLIVGIADIWVDFRKLKPDPASLNDNE